MQVKRSAKVAISLAWYAAGRISEVVSPARKSRLTILFYHAVRAQDLAGFRWQLDAIKAYADVVGPDYTGGPSSRPKIAITFDDAFASMVENALPELALRQMTCTIFVPTGCLGAQPKWLIGATWHDRDEVVADREALRSTMSTGARLGSHSRSHPNLTQIGAPEAQEEISGSKTDVMMLFGQATDLFAFPYGLYDLQALGLCKKAGYRFVYSVEPGSVDPADTAMLRPRVGVEPSDTRLEFWLKIRGGYNWMRHASLLKRKILGAVLQDAVTPVSGP